MTENAKPTGRPLGSTTGQKPLRTLRMGAEWERGQRLEAELAALEGRKANMTMHVEMALLQRNDRLEKLLARRNAEQAQPSE